ncbi:ATP-binding cassette domain-containing protein [Pseudoflavitalea sp. X16]|uniref:ABC-F family ATP-binding cassette domain-containing protein n=1 Tax=Paraflavitalea devenefica TaxID=2716334 RepID=UPI00141FD51B|nr:ABC-F family ATP-binding cassette domain-containing protein [Paraflavitalea devenefica]NII27930.1 ATP-binding cassette domain-containing protein [Paraflavitalea devenefica]
MLAGFTNMTFEFGARAIVEDATWHIQPNERIGLIGYNGTGKSTLLKLLVGEYLPSAGTVERSRGTSIGYLHQDLLSFDTNDSILEVALGAFERVRQLEVEIEEVGKELEKTGDEDLLHKYTDLLHEMETLGGYNIHHKTEEILQGLGFANADLQRPYKEFSGGWRMRVLLAKMILQAPDLLLLDEPTNHLDLPSIEWLEKYLVHYQGSVVIISHDKYFLNRMVTKIIELYQRRLHIYNGNYSFYETEKEQRLELMQRAYENQQDYIRQQERFIERFKAKASKAAAAQSAMKRLDKLDRLEDIGIERPSLRINFQVDKTPGKVLCELKHIGKSFGTNKIIEHTGAEINRGDKIALIGANGKGKSTVLRIIAGVESFTGDRRWGHNVDESFYAQHQLEALNVNNTILDEMKEAGSQKTELELRTILGCFLFSGDDADKKIKVLSGGEKARVALAKTIISKANFLMLDEPTNHLDMHTVDLLIEALNKYEGSLILVSHDRYFISKVANKIWEIDNYQIKDFDGGYEEWVEWKERMKKKKEEEARIQHSESRMQKAGTGNQKSEVRNPKSEEKPNTQPSSDVRPQTSAPVQPPAKQEPINKEAKKELQKKQRLFKELEEKITTLTTRKSELETLLASPDVFSDKNKFLSAEREYKSVTENLKEASDQYEKVFESIIDLESQ